MIYLIITEDNLKCKIGKANDPIKRLKQLQTGCPYKLYLKETVDGGVTLEKHYHKKYRKYREQGEWFCYNSEITLNEKFSEIEYNDEIKIDGTFIISMLDNFNASETGRILKMTTVIKGDNNILYFQEKPFNKKSLMVFLDLSRNRFLDFINKLKKHSIIYEEEKIYIFNPFMAKRNKNIVKDILCYFPDLRILKDTPIGAVKNP